ncbi:molybdopterin-dependent oxidoreductase [Cohnella ginsengisoli]|uniref:Molybdopterin-dependent oxidoreductase n=1 Tax=Cohnella ginsengisoli TaxID=425004 RepID=A0A9X4KI98_9BACL|nr:molybdopterin-dependent oxidoreductase [Cohnella ginsengisoli]MDG0792672.1 molybdopterin-dependent oxidoreductase [Cohnella ginsengisoli]
MPESSDWYNSGYILVWGSNLPMTRTPDAHFLAEARYKGTKVVSISPDYAEYVKFADTWMSVKQGTDGALAMAMGHVILKEFYVDNETDYFIQYAKQYTDFPNLILIEERDGGYAPGRFLLADDLGQGGQQRRVENGRLRRQFRYARGAEGQPRIPLGRGGHLEPAHGTSGRRRTDRPALVHARRP